MFRYYDGIAKNVTGWVLISEGWLSGTRYASVNRIPLDIWQQNFMFLCAPSITISSTCLSSIRLKSSADVTTAASRSQITLRQTRRSWLQYSAICYCAFSRTCMGTTSSSCWAFWTPSLDGCVIAAPWQMHSDSQVRSRMAEREAGRRDDDCFRATTATCKPCHGKQGATIPCGIMILPLRPPTDWRRRLCGIRKRKQRCRQGYEAAMPAAACERILSVLYAPYRTLAQICSLW